MTIYCVDCEKEVEARLSDGKEAYPHRADLHSLPFWFCDTCKNFVGCHHKTSNRTKPLGVIPNKELKKYRMALHSVIDPMWKTHQMSRKKIYSHISRELGKQYHTADIKSVEEAQKIQNIVYKLREQLTNNK